MSEFIRTRVAALLIGGTVVVAGCQQAPEEAPTEVPLRTGARPPETEEQLSTDQSTEAGFVEAYRRAHRARDVQAVLKLVHWEGVDPKTREGITRAFTKDFQLGLKDAKLGPVRNSGPAEVKTPEGTLRANLKATRELTVQFEKQNLPNGDITARTRPVGVVDGRYFFAATIRANNVP